VALPVLTHAISNTRGFGEFGEFGEFICLFRLVLIKLLYCWCNRALVFAAIDAVTAVLNHRRTMWRVVRILPHFSDMHGIIFDGKSLI